ncbi:MAG: hypothetical protein IPM63_04265 [Acidobacteriota bacterium]|nr:MAG: hypothetical protein IPM63_04265 [Acidobacteriota bacterium]
MTGPYCPRCGQQQASANIRFCSRCGFVMNGIDRIVANGGVPQEFIGPGSESPKKRGVKQGGLLMLSSLILVPLLAIISAALDISPVFVAVTAVVTFWGGLLRILYALIFESGKPTGDSRGFVDSFKHTLSGRPSPASLPPSAQAPAETAFHPAPGSWRDTNDLEPTSVTEVTTRTLDRSRIDEN